MPADDALISTVTATAYTTHKKLVAVILQDTGRISFCLETKTCTWLPKEWIRCLGVAVCPRAFKTSQVLFGHKVAAEHLPKAGMLAAEPLGWPRSGHLTPAPQDGDNSCVGESRERVLGLGTLPSYKLQQQLTPKFHLQIASAQGEMAEHLPLDAQAKDTRALSAHSHHFHSDPGPSISTRSTRGSFCPAAQVCHPSTS